MTSLISPPQTTHTNTHNGSPSNQHRFIPSLQAAPQATDPSSTLIPQMIGFGNSHPLFSPGKMHTTNSNALPSPPKRLAQDRSLYRLTVAPSHQHCRGNVHPGPAANKLFHQLSPMRLALSGTLTREEHTHTSKSSHIP